MGTGIQKGGRRPLTLEHIDDPCYIQGYTAAIQDAIQVVEYIQTDLKSHGRKQNAKTYTAILKCMLKGRVLLRESSTAFVRCSDHAKDGFEIWDSRYNNMSKERAAAVIAALCGDVKSKRMEEDDEAGRTD